MQRQNISSLYGIQIFFIFILDLLATYKIINDNNENFLNYDVYLGNINFLLNTKALILIDVYFFALFYLEYNLNAIYQNILLKIISIGIWIILACRTKFYSYIICIFALKIMSIFFLLRSLYLMEDLIYVKYNKKIGVDAKTINKYFLYEIIIHLKNIDAIFECLSMFLCVSLEKILGKKPYSIVKLFLFIFDILIRKKKYNTQKIFNFYNTFIFFRLYLLYNCYYYIF